MGLCLCSAPSLGPGVHALGRTTTTEHERLVAALPHSVQALTLGPLAAPCMGNQVVAVARAPSRSASGY